MPAPTVCVSAPGAGCTPRQFLLFAIFNELFLTLKDQGVSCKGQVSRASRLIERCDSCCSHFRKKPRAAGAGQRLHPNMGRVLSRAHHSLRPYTQPDSLRQVSSGALQIPECVTHVHYIE